MLKGFVGLIDLHHTARDRKALYVTGFGKMCIVHTSDFAYLEIHKNHREWYLDVKLSGMIKE